MDTTESAPLLAWERSGDYVTVGDDRIFVVDLPAAQSPTTEPVLVVHGFPTSSFDFAGIAPSLAEKRRVVLVDLLGFGFSSKPDRRYSMAGQADIVTAVVEQLGITELAMLTHDMGDTVGGELLARQLEGEWDVEVTRRVVTNGSIYIAMAHLTAGQEWLLSMPDEALPEAMTPPVSALSQSLVATLAPGHQDVDMSDHAALIARAGGNRLLARTVRYIEERRAQERRFTGAIETHPSPLHVVWGVQDPIAVAPMVDRLTEARPDSHVTRLEGAGHYLQLEEPGAFTEAILDALA